MCVQCVRVCVCVCTRAQTDYRMIEDGIYVNMLYVKGTQECGVYL